MHYCLIRSHSYFVWVLAANTTFCFVNNYQISCVKSWFACCYAKHMEIQRSGSEFVACFSRARCVLSWLIHLQEQQSGWRFIWKRRNWKSSISRQLITDWLIYLFIHSFIHSFIQSFIHSVIHSFSHSVIVWHHWHLSNIFIVVQFHIFVL